MSRTSPAWGLASTRLGRIHLYTAAAALLLFGSTAASAEPFTMLFTGTVTILPSNPVPGFEGVAIGDTVNGTIEFDTGTPDSLSEPWAGRYETAIRSFRVSAGDSSLSLGPSGLAVEDAVGFPRFDLITFGAADPTNTFQLLAQFLDPDVIQGDRIPTDAAVYMRFADRHFRILHVPDFDASPRGLAGTIDSVSIAPAPVPEPGTLILAATGLGLLRRYRWRAI